MRLILNIIKVVCGLVKTKTIKVGDWIQWTDSAGKAQAGKVEVIEYNGQQGLREVKAQATVIGDLVLFTGTKAAMGWQVEHIISPTAETRRMPKMA